MYMGHLIIDPYYKGYVGMVMNKAASEIEAGNSKRVQKVLSEVRYRPSYNEIASLLMKLNSNETAVQAGPAQPAAQPADKVPEKDQPPTPTPKDAPR